jgi:hypothetical protein
MLAPSVPPTHACRFFYGVGAGDSAGDGDSVAPSVFGGVFFAALCFRGGVGVGLAAAAGAVVVAVVPCCWQETTNATLIKALIKHSMYLFIGCQLQFDYRRKFGRLKSSEYGTSEAFFECGCR